MNSLSETYFAEAKKYIPGGVNSPVRAFSSVGLNPVYIDRGEGSRLFDVDGNEYIDYVGSWGPLILGHADKRIQETIQKTIARGTSFGANTEIEVRFARLISEIYPSMERIRMVNSGTEATMSAVRLARGYTGRDKIIKFEGCYHGHGDSFLIKAGSGVLTLGLPGSPGITRGTAADTLIAEYNNLDSVKELLLANKDEIAAVIIEPVMGNAGLILPQEGFLKGLRELTETENTLLIFDEVITGFRLALGGAQQVYGIRPDLTCLGKIIGGGFPVGAFGGARRIMEHLAPEGPVYQAGTLAGNPVAMQAGYRTVQILRDENPYPALEEKGQALERGFKENQSKLGVSFAQNRAGSMFCRFFTGRNVEFYRDAMSADTKLFSRYFAQMLTRGIYMAPSQFETGFVSAAHSLQDIKITIAADYDSLKAVI
ncbi:MAG: glutamate-1-semialdehyde-2,1-aminomutase [Spirochaetales bacterium]|nr:MAG: glutamate-1-semialdehyde-2,1-aminomutase [Spirochaetales bacterium]